MTKVSHETRNARVKQTAEVFTPPALIREMLDKLPPEMWEPGRTFIDPAAGNGNMVLAVIFYKHEKHGHPILDALRTTYAVELMKDNVTEMRHRIAKYAISRGAPIEEAAAIIKRNIVHANALEYDYTF